ncbi:MAG TPA: hypothetical protein VH834_22035 [Solirubrobacteraceae bacterium]|jgi:hypothetical protein
MNRIEPIGPARPGPAPVSRPAPGKSTRRSTDRDDRRGRGKKQPQPEQPRREDGRLDVRA